MSGFVIFLIAIAGSIALIIRYYKRSAYSENDQKFSQAGVVVDYTNGTFSIGGKQYPVSAVKATRWETDLRGHQNVAYAYILVEDMSNPTHKIKFIRNKHCEQFLERFALAIKKAGGPVLR